MVNNNEGVTMILKNEKGVAVVAKRMRWRLPLCFFCFAFPNDDEVMIVENEKEEQRGTWCLGIQETARRGPGAQVTLVKYQELKSVLSD